MKLTPSRPVTIEAVRYGERWFPFMFRHSDNSLLLYIEHGHDRHFSPCHRLRSVDEGKTWTNATDNVPRVGWCHSFGDGQLFEIDCYGVQDPHAPQYAGFFGAWSYPGRPGSEVEKSIIRVHCPSSRPQALQAMTQGYPTFPWWNLWNTLHRTDELKGDEIFLNGPIFGSGVELEDGRLLALGYYHHRDPAILKSCVWCYESSDRGRNWEEISLVGRNDSTPEGPDEATLARLADGRLYAVIRTGGTLQHTWSQDLGRSWTPLQDMTLVDSDHKPGWVWPIVKVLPGGELVMVYGRPGKHMVFDPTGTGTQWQGRLDLHAWELDTQKLMGVALAQRINNQLSPNVRYWNSGDYLGLVASGPREMLVVYDVQHFVQDWNSLPFSGVRMLRVRLED